MNQQDFSLILKNLDTLIKKCVALKKEVGVTKLQDMSVVDYNKIIDKASQLQSEQDKITSHELYHILGMGNLTVTQQATFISKIKEFLETRSIVKYVAGQPKVNVGTPKSKSEYVCATLLPNKKLVSQN